MLPSAKHKPFTAYPMKNFNGDWNSRMPNPNQLAWNSFDIPEVETDFVDGLSTICGAGNGFTFMVGIFTFFL